MLKVDAIGIVPPWLGGDLPRVMDDGNYLPVLPIIPGPPDWDVVKKD